MAPSVALIDYGQGNLGSLLAALGRLEADPIVWRTPEDMHAPIDAIILPGVGSIQGMSQKLTESGISEALEGHRREGTPILGICLGAQLLLDSSEEGGIGLGWISGTVARLEAPTLPHMGWNRVQARPHSALLKGLPPASPFYFVHSYHMQPAKSHDVQGTTYYHQEIAAVVERAPLYGVQFHPELSGTAGHTVLKNFLATTLEAMRPVHDEAVKNGGSDGSLARTRPL